MHQEKYSLKWQTYPDHLKSMMKELMMQFIYLGEATFYEERMNEFLAVGKLLEIKELCNAETEEVENEEYDQISPSDPVTSIEEFDEPKVASNNDAEGGGVVSTNFKHKCDQCNKTFASSGSLCNHKKAVHQGVKYSCNQCDYQATLKGNLDIHIQSKHEGVKYSCNQCNYQATQKVSLSQHIQSKHEGVKYSCNQCDYQATKRGNLSGHIQSKHEGVKYECNQCDFASSWQPNLINHRKKSH